MSTSDNSTAAGGIGFGGALTILFIGLKLGHVIDWSWWWVLSPLWIPVALVLAILAVMLVIVGAKEASHWSGSSRRRPKRHYTNTRN